MRRPDPAEEVRMVAVDGTDALAYVIVRPDPDNPKMAIAEAAARGISKRDAGEMLLRIGRAWVNES